MQVLLSNLSSIASFEDAEHLISLPEFRESLFRALSEKEEFLVKAQDHPDTVLLLRGVVHLLPLTASLLRTLHRQGPSGETGEALSHGLKILGDAFEEVLTGYQELLGISDETIDKALDQIEELEEKLREVGKEQLARRKKVAAEKKSVEIAREKLKNEQELLNRLEQEIRGMTEERKEAQKREKRLQVKIEKLRRDREAERQAIKELAGACQRKQAELDVLGKEDRSVEKLKKNLTTVLQEVEKLAADDDELSSFAARNGK